MNKEHQKILVFCEHGSVRSVAMGYLIKTIYQHQHEVLNCGIKDISDSSFHMLADWADKIIFMDRKSVFNKKPELKDDPHKEKFIVLEVGKDEAHNPQDQELLHKCLRELKNLNL